MYESCKTCKKKITHASNGHKNKMDEYDKKIKNKIDQADPLAHHNGRHNSMMCISIKTGQINLTRMRIG